MRKTRIMAAAICLMVIGSPAFGQMIIFDNASTLAGAGTYGLVTNPGAGFNGGDLSALTAPDINFGFSANPAGPFRLADNFTVPAGFQWTVNGFHTFSYLTGSAVPSVTGATVQVWNGTPGAGGTIIAGDTTTNVLTTNAFAGPTAIWRAQNTAPLTNNRQIQDSTLTLGTPLVLSAGTYWIDYDLTGAGFVPPMALATGGAVTGDALQDVGGVYGALVDGTVPKGVPFLVFGSVSSVPEPTSLALLCIGAIGYGWRRLRKKS